MGPDPRSPSLKYASAYTLHGYRSFDDMLDLTGLYNVSIERGRAVDKSVESDVIAKNNNNNNSNPDYRCNIKITER